MREKGGTLRIDFGDKEENLDEFFQIFDKSKLVARLRYQTKR
jgi:hypothetical protein